jgi:hypothetical protein
LNHDLQLIIDTLLLAKSGDGGDGCEDEG